MTQTRKIIITLSMAYALSAMLSHAYATNRTEPTTGFKYGVSAGSGLSWIVDDRAGAGDWRLHLSNGAEVYARWDYEALFALQAGIGYADVKAWRKYHHPQPYVFSKTVVLNGKRAQIPLSFIIMPFKGKPDGLWLSLGGGPFVATNLELKLSNQLDYYHNTVIEEVDALEDGPEAIFGYHAFIELMALPFSVGVGYFRDATPYRLEYLDTGELRHWGFRIYLSFTGK